MNPKRSPYSHAIIIALSLTSSFARAEDASPRLSLSEARKLVDNAISDCEAKNFKVSAAVVDASGQMIAFGRGDRATPHTQTSSFRKAYTVATLAPIFGFSKLGDFVQKVGQTPQGAAIATLPDILLLAGAVAIVKDGVVVGALGVGGAPGGDRDEACAIEAVNSARS
ncbi:GlcG/HbpS family heme-binding protein [Allorhizobium pseudoryzae]|uniref:GlcG/HbpS family heme-binding protein n=1 Tax=Allorhizobium pseudoryzae TaxID=379684 RepID=UPI003D05218E